MPVTPKLGLELFAPLGVGWREDATAGALLDYNMMLLDAASGGGGSSVSINSALVSDPNFKDSATVSFHISGSDVTATAAVAAPPAGTTGNIQGKNGSAFAGMAGSVIDFVNGTLSIAPPDGGSASVAALSITGDNFSNNILDLFVNGGSTPALSVNSSGSLLADMEVNSNLLVPAGANITIGAGGAATLKDYTGSAGTNGDVLSSTATGVKWVAPTAAQVNSDWNAGSGVAQILNKPTLFSGAYSDLSGKPTIPSSFAWNVEGNADGDLTLANAGFKTTFNQTSAVAWLWANSTAATAAGAVSGSPVLNLAGTYFTLGASAVDTWSLSTSISAPKTSATVGNTSETAGSVVTMAVTAGTGTFAPGDVVTFTSLPTFTWLNGQNVTLNGNTTSTSLQFTDPTTHGTQASHNEAGGQVTQANPVSMLSLSHAGSAGLAYVNVASSNLCFTGKSGTGAGSSAMSIIDSGPGTSMTFTSTASNAFNQFIFANGVAGITGTLQLTITSTLIGLRAIGASAAAALEGSNVATTTGDCSVNLGATAVYTSLSGSIEGVRIGPRADAAATTHLEFQPVYGTAAFRALNIAPTINQAAVTDTIAGVQVTGGNLVTLVFADTTSTFTNGATTLTVAAVTNTAVNGSGNTIASYVRRTGITVVTNSAEAAVTNVVTLSMANTGSMATNDYISITGLTVATWLNGTVVKLTGVSANVSITFVDPTGHGLKASGAEGGGVVICHYLTYSKTISNITLGSDTGTATQQATGNYTALQIAVTETAVGGSTNYLINALAGAAGTTQKFSVDNKGTITNAGGRIVNRVTKAAGYTSTATDYVLSFTATATLVLDSGAAVSGTTYRIKLSASASAGALLTIAPNNSKTIDGAASMVISVLGNAVDVVYDSVTNDWQVF